MTISFRHGVSLHLCAAYPQPSGYSPSGRRRCGPHGTARGLRRGGAPTYPWARRWRSPATAALLGAAAVLIWQSRAPVTSRSSLEVHSSDIPPVRAVLHSSSGAAPSSRPAPTSTMSMRIQFRESRNYAELVRRFAGSAAAGDPIAQYLTARALKYCNETANLHRSFRYPGG